MYRISQNFLHLKLMLLQLNFYKGDQTWANNLTPTRYSTITHRMDNNSSRERWQIIRVITRQIILDVTRLKLKLFKFESSTLCLEFESAWDSTISNLTR